ncbi:MAG: carbohydrate ABC transporter permease [Treponema sp.]|nr:carbohydrate ABC transporter permease [Treponema sp.]MCI5666382.1 carbohydrate ABC transporter permease [Spirochaetia bacterium]MDD7768325.1 carbohydrate ABC transporter permease [Treponema sp.]MDY3130791.1 carbohydrate ABC transporter permease [Treponema sp.]
MRKENQIKESLGYEIFKVVNTVLMLIICFVTLYPFLYLVAQSFSSEQAIMSGKVGLIPVDFNLETYISVLKKGDFLRSYKNTLIYSVIGTFLSLLFSCCLAYPLSKKEVVGSKVILKLIIFTMYFGGGLIPNYVLMQRLHLINKVAGFIIPSLLSTYYIILMKSFFSECPHELEEAGELDGLSPIGIFAKIVFPLSMPIIATMILFNAVGYWNNWYNAFLYLDKREQWPVAYYLRTIINGASTSADPGEVSAEKMQIAANIKSCSMVLMALPIICIYPFVQKYYVQGMMLGGVKE